MYSLPSDEARKEYLKKLPEPGWAMYLAAWCYHDALQRNMLIQKLELVLDKLKRVRALV